MFDLRDESWTPNVPDVATRIAATEAWNTSPGVVVQDDNIPKEHRGFIRRLDVSEQYLRNCYQSYVRLCSKQEDIISGNLDIRKTVLALPELPDLQSVQTYELPYRPNRFFGVLIGMEESPVPFLSSLQRATLLQEPFTNFYIPMGEASCTRSARALACLINSLSRLDEPSRVQNLTISVIPWCFWQPDLTVSYWH